MGNIKNFKDLDIWKKGIELTIRIYKLTAHFPKEELYGLTSQLRRASVSVPSNTSEGFKRTHKAEFIQFLNIALGSLAEIETQIIISEKLEYVSKEEMEEITERIDHLNRMTVNLVKKIKGN